MKNEVSNVEFLVSELASWSDSAFGDPSFRGPVGVLKHLEKEAVEAAEAYGTDGFRHELADCFLLLVDAARRGGVSLSDLLAASNEKLQINKKRTWATPTSDRPIHHVR